MYDLPSENYNTDELPAVKANRAKALMQRIGMPDQSTSAYVTNDQPADSVNISDAGGGVKRIGNYRSEGGIDNFAGGTDAENKYLRDRYATDSASWRQQHPDMTMTNGAGENFSMRQSMPRLRAQAAMDQINFMRSGKLTDAEVANKAALAKIAENESGARVRTADALTGGLTLAQEQQKEKARRDLEEYTGGTALRAAKSKGELDAELYRQKGDEFKRTSGPSFADLAAADSYSDVTPAEMATLQAGQRNMVNTARGAAKGRSKAFMDLYKPAAGETERDFGTAINNSDVLGGDLKLALAAVDNAGSRNAFARTMGGIQDWSNSVMGNNGSPIGDVGGALPAEIESAKKSVLSLAEKAYANGLASDMPTAIKMTVSKINRAKDTGRAQTKAGVQMSAALEELARHGGMATPDDPHGMSPAPGRPAVRQPNL